MVKKSLTITLLVMILSITLLAGCSKSESGLQGSGTIEADETKVVAQIPGAVQAISVTEGERVKAGDQLIKLDDADLQLQVSAAQAALTAAQAQSSEIKKGPRSQQIAQAQANVNQANAVLSGAIKARDLAAKQLQDYQALLASGAITEKDLDAIQAKYDAANAQAEAAQQQVKAAQEQLALLQAGATQEAITSGNAQVAQAASKLKMAQLQLDKSIIKAPINGVVTAVAIKKGELANPGLPLVSIADLSNLWVKVYIPENRLGQVKLGNKVKVTVDSFPQESFAGEIIYISPEAEFTPNNVQTKEKRVTTVFAVKIKITSGTEKLKPGMAADVTF